MTTDPSSSGTAALDNVSDQDLLAEVMRRYPPRDKQFYPPAFFQFLNRYRHAVTFEAVMYRLVGDRIELLMRHRGAAEAYPHTMHIPGSFLLLGERSLEALQRIVTREVGPNVRIASTQLAGPLFDLFEVRGPQVHLIWVLGVDGEPESDDVSWMPVDEALALPNLIDHHRAFLDGIALPVIRGEHPSSLWEEFVPF